MNSATLQTITNNTIHPMAHAGYKYRTQVISGWKHVEEYVRPLGVWVNVGKCVLPVPS